MKHTKIILICGKAQSGKDTAADHISYQLNNKYQGDFQQERYSFAKPLKDFLINVFQVPYQSCYGTNADKDKLTHLRWSKLPIEPLEIDVIRKAVNAKDDTLMTGREVMEVFGSFICRKFFPDCWVAATANAIKAAKWPHIALITDVRFPNEIDYLQGPNTYIIRLRRNPLNRQVISETALDTYIFPQERCFEIDNQGVTIDRKNTELNKILENILNG